MKWFKKLSIRIQVMIIGLIIIAMVPIIVWNVYKQMSELIIDQNTQYNKELIEIMKERVSSNYAEVSKLMVNLGYDATVQNFLAESDNLKIYEISKKIDSLMDVFKNTNPDILDISIVNNAGKLISLKGSIPDIYNLASRPEQGGAVHYAGFRTASHYNDRDKFLFNMNIFSLGNKATYGENAGYLMISLDSHSINKEIEKYPRLAGTNFYLFENNHLVFSNSSQDKDLIEQINSLHIEKDQDQSVIKTSAGKRYILQSHVLPEIEGKIVTATPISILMKGLQPLKTKSFALVLIMLLLISIPYSILMMNILKPLSKLMTFMKQLKTGSLNILQSKVRLEGYAEIEMISSEFNTMLQRINNLTNQLIQSDTELYQSELEKQRLQYAFLQSQINPHFLSNTLDTIKGIAIAQGSKETYEMAGALSRMLRYSIKGGDEVSLGDELQIVEAYIRIHQLRFSDRFTYKQHCPEELMQLRIPKMIIQPVVENALTHGLETLATGGIVSIHVQQDDQGVLTVTISDNGSGIAPARLEELHNMLDSGDKDKVLKEHIGVANVHHRIHVKYGDPYGLSLRSEQGRGTEVTLSFPSVKSDFHVDRVV
ncbi:cache domain-containing sensor histidine kinase [Paenibacillus sp. EC2-1]|uniref:cache domain-containing sensor histidine kinase n=1 Tax=Paenibacillus sp. EC2-1 TaxID=3388665 RepID=UPI003BEEC837